jgi:hypothetical protein
LPFETVFGVWNFSAVLYNAGFINYMSFVCVKLFMNTICFFFFICICLLFFKNKQITKKPKKLGDTLSFNCDFLKAQSN